MFTCVSFRANGFINRGGRHWLPFFNVKREQEITKEEAAMSFLCLFARGAQGLNAGLKADIFPKSCACVVDF